VDPMSLLLFVAYTCHAGVVPTWRETNATSVLKITTLHEIFTVAEARVEIP
jgi:hypothetical protein